MAGAPAGPARNPERPAGRRDAVRETDESPARAPGPASADHRPDQLVHVGLLRLGQGALPRRWAATSRHRGSADAGVDRRWAVLAEDDERCWSSRSAFACVVARLVAARIRSRTRSCCWGRAQAPSARPLGRSRIVVEGSRGAGQSELMLPCLESSDVCGCRDCGRLQRVFVHTNRNLPTTSRRVPDVASPSDNARAAGRSIA
jgi:hypothetical protein